MQYAVLGFDFGFISKTTYFRGIYETPTIERYPNEIREIKISKEKWILNFTKALSENYKILRSQKLNVLGYFIIIKTLIRVFFFLISRQVRLLARFFKYHLFKFF